MCGIFSKVFKAKLKCSMKSHFYFYSFSSYIQGARLLMLVWVKRCIFCVKDMENQLVMNVLMIFYNVPLMILLQILKCLFCTWLHVCVACLCLLTESILNLFFSLVILDSPTGMSSDVWVHVQENVAKITKVRN